MLPGQNPHPDPGLQALMSDTSLDGIRIWAAYHDGQVTAWWDTQHQWNAKREQWEEETDKKMSSYQKTQIVSGIISGTAVAVGTALIFAFVNRWFAGG